MRIQRWSSETEAAIANDNQETTYVGRRTLVEGQVRRKGNGPAADDAAALVQRAQGSGGIELPEGLRGKFEGSLGADLGGVRVHTGADSAAAASSVGARAYALGQDVHFGAGEYTPGTSAGDTLLAHEVAHTVQQGGSAGATPQFALEVSQPGDAFETEADSAAAAMVTGQPAQVSRGSAGVSRAIIQRATPETPAAPEGGKGAELDHDDMVWLQGEAADRLDVSLLHYSRACTGLIEKLKSKAKLDAEIAALMLDVAMGFLIPGLGKLTVGLLKQVTQECSAGIQEAAALVDTDIAKAGVTGMTKAAVLSAKNDPTFVNADAEHFLGGLFQKQSETVQSLRGKLRNETSADTLLGTLAAYDTTVTNEASYRQEISGMLDRLASQVGGQRVVTREEQVAIDCTVKITTDTHAAYVPGPGGRPKLAVVKFTNISNEQEHEGGGGIFFLEWVSPELVEMASERTKEITGWLPRHLSGPITDLPGT